MFLAYFICKARIFDSGFGEILRSSLLQWAEKHKFQPDSRKPGVTDPSLINLYAKQCTTTIL